MARLYFRKDNDENCFTIESHKAFMHENGIKELKIYEAKRETGTGLFFCKYYFAPGEVNQACGKVCQSYDPNNGKNGRCKYYGYVYEQTENELTLTL